MGKINWAGVMTALGKTGEMDGAPIVLFNVWGFLLGIAAAWLYAVQTDTECIRRADIRWFRA